MFGWLGVADAVRSASEERQCHSLLGTQSFFTLVAPSKWQEANFKLAR